GLDTRAAGPAVASCRREAGHPSGRRASPPPDSPRARSRHGHGPRRPRGAAGARAPMTERVGLVAGLGRYPIKSLDGEIRHELAFDERGVELDRVWALVDEDGGIASGKTTRRFRKVPGLLRHAGRMDGDLSLSGFSTGARPRSTPLMRPSSFGRSPALAGLSSARTRFPISTSRGSI